MHVEFWRGISLENDYLQDREGGGRIMLKFILAIFMDCVFVFVYLNFTCYFCSVNFIVFFFLFSFFLSFFLSFILSAVILEHIFMQHTFFVCFNLKKKPARMRTKEVALFVLLVHSLLQGYTDFFRRLPTK